MAAKSAPTPAEAPSATEVKIPAGTESAPLVAPRNDDFFDNRVGETFGGDYPRLLIAINEASPMLVCVKNTTQIQVDNGKGPEMMVVQLAELADKPGSLVSLPIAAIFKKNYGFAELIPGDKFKVGRYPDGKKKRGAGAGNAMENYGVKVYHRVERPKKDSAPATPTPATA